MLKRFLLVAIGCGRLPGVIKIMKTRNFVVFGSMDAKSLSRLSINENINEKGVSVIFYETG